jgi:hypothetical protein
MRDTTEIDRCRPRRRPGRCRHVVARAAEQQSGSRPKPKE